MADQVRKYAKGVVLDMGTGSGIQAEAALEKPEVTAVYAVDKNPAAVAHCKKSVKHRKLVCLKSDLFAAFKGKLNKIKFDTIIFNPPYLPADGKKHDMALIGGKKGYEVIQRFLDQAPKFLAPDGQILLLFSNVTHKQKVEEFIAYNGLDFKPLASARMFFEELFVYLITKNAAAKKLEPKGFSNIHYFDDGNRGIIYTADYKGKKVAIKLKKPESEAIGRMRNEGKTLALVNAHGMGPKLVEAKPDFVAYEFVEGTHVRNWLPDAPKAKVKPVLKDLFEQGFKLDQMNLTKEEMHRPLKNAIVTKKNKVVLIDWERSHPSKKPHNVTQLCQFILVWKNTLKKKGIKIDDKKLILAAKAYKTNPSHNTFKGILDLVHA